VSDVLPEGWESPTLGEAFKWGSGGTPKSTVSEYYGGDIPWAVIGDLTDGIMGGTASSITDAGLGNSSAKWVEEGSVLLAMYGSIGKLGLVVDPLTTNQAIAFTQPDPVDAKYLFWYLRRVRADLSRRGKGGTQKNISQTVIKGMPFLLAPLPEQRRIVAKIEELFSELDAGVAALERAQAKLERYRASVLKAAVEGKLTEQWRAENPPKETGEELLKRILVERRIRWEAEQLAKFEAKGKKPPKNWKEKYKEPVGPDTSELPELPEGWCWGTVDQVGSVGGGITKGGKKREAERRSVPYLRVANVQRGRLDLSVVKEIAASDDEIRRYSLEPGDVLFNEGGDRDKLGRGWVWCGEIPLCLHQNHVFRVRLFLPEFASELISHYGNSAGQEWFFRRASQTVNLASINQAVLRSLPVPVPPGVEQKELIDRLSDVLQAVDRAEREVQYQMSRAVALHQSILKRAFEGRLVPQEPSDETASVLLERIRSEREAEKPKKKSRTKKKANQESLDI
jgi:type I restriction enzyme, S subunit